mmetsp:Transcript_140/g.277  ORF Transcript_140/g.277 Transcript_140/m.277 type:complete len:938 (+) Transcript_140:152-2965(+)|eukprot:CAMPEP_0117747050 /NCGR_PEP_ID=MMETSP0947-20121206/8288_1 /TAXON_ID=44440 /ORGANISM="Chattonella subsalsa, Strain CCMP2191" /LENGTH=937 /DNA_ID=CAMNT_0005564445 /DNA_START=82 /DNA_END=2895 /DNA_ORIENTATION=-
MHKFTAVAAANKDANSPGPKKKEELLTEEDLRTNLLNFLAEARAKKEEGPVEIVNKDDEEKRRQDFPCFYDYLAYKMFIVTESSIFNATIIFFILIAAVIVGIQSYDSMADNEVVTICDGFVLGVFTLEVVLKVIACGRKPWKYFVGPEWRWNNFDFLIVLLCMPFVDLGGGVAFLRLLRLMRVTKIIKRVPQLQMIVKGLVQGMSSIVYILLLLLLVFYLFAVMGVFSFGENDPAHFGGLPIAALTLFRCSTLEDWTDIMYINMLGCDVYDGGLYTNMTKPEMIHTSIGDFFSYSCYSPKNQPVFASIYFLFFTVVSAFVILSLFIGAVTMGMSSSLEAMAEKKREKNEEMVGNTVSETWLKEILDEAFEKPKPIEHNGFLKAKYLELAKVFNVVQQSAIFNNFMLAIIILAGVLVGLSTEMEDNPGLKALDIVVLAIFTAEVVIKVIATGEKPARYFQDSWNRFDCFIVFTSYIPLCFNNDLGPLISMLRLLRLLRVLKLVKSLPQLRIIVEALIEGFNSITFITLILLLFFYIFAIVGMIIFKNNDPWHFGKLEDAMLTLFRCATLEDWTDVMYINMFGCDNYGYDGMEEECKNPKRWGWLAGLYFVVFVILGALVLLTLFLGVVTTSMEKATRQMKATLALQEQIDELIKEHEIQEAGVDLFRKIFKMIDQDEEGSLDFEELLPVMLIIGQDMPDEEIVDLYLRVDIDGSGDIDFAEFLEIMVYAKEWFQEKLRREQNDSKSNSRISEHSRDRLTGSLPKEKSRSRAGDERSLSSSSHRNLLEAQHTAGLSFDEHQNEGAAVAPEAGQANPHVSDHLQKKIMEGRDQNKKLKSELESLARKVCELAEENQRYHEQLLGMGITSKAAMHSPRWEELKRIVPHVFESHQPGGIHRGGVRESVGSVVGSVASRGSTNNNNNNRRKEDPGQSIEKEP